jgi:anti-sigma B factor antagonist
MELQVSARREGADATVVAVRGDIDNDSAPALREALVAAFAAGAKRVVVDLTTTDFLDSSGLGALVGVSKEYARDGELVLVCPRPQLRKLFKISRLDEVLAVHPDLESALG